MSEINPYAPPEGEYQRPDGAPGADDGDMWKEGKFLVLRKTAVFPDRCVKCNDPANGQRLLRKLTWHRPAWYFLILVHILVYIIVALCVRKTARIHIGICDRHLARRRSLMLAGWLCFAVGTGLLFVGVQKDPQIALLCMPLWLAALVLAVIVSRIVIPRRIDDEFVWLQGAHADFLAQLRELDPRELPASLPRRP